ncbi:PTS lactose/cellobiose transporter subunit IIA [Amedibacillus sp. YH-ame10]
MTREEGAMVGFEIVAYAGDARSKLVQALTEAERGNFELAKQLVEESKECLTMAHQAQTDMLHAEASGEAVDVGFIMVHGQDHLMTTMLLRDVVHSFITLFERTSK